jgi:hypothetical protein
MSVKSISLTYASTPYFCIQSTNMSKHTQILMQYETSLPDDFSMDDVRKRAISKAQQFDQLPGLEFKLYAINDLNEAPVNEYSPIYLWSNQEAYRGFLVGDLFDNYAKAFARPSVRGWLIHETIGDRESLRESRYALRQILPLPRETHIGNFLDLWTGRQQNPNALFHVVGFDPFQWQFVDLTVWKDRPELRSSSHRYGLVEASVPAFKTDRTTDRQ